MLLPGEEILIEQVAEGGFIVSPKTVTGLSRLTDIHVFETIDGLKGFIDKHFSIEKKEAK